ncbi:MAG: hypothetical protein VB086_10800 [Clostridiaceae bacterium]|nr:hypothetical protein [Clostridiaceae bacterium]
MYVHHKIKALILFIVVVILSFIIGAAYKDLALAAITAVSISLAVYIAAMTALLGSPYSDRLKTIVDKKIKTKSQLGVLTTYLRVAGGFSVITLIISSLYQFTSLKINNSFLSQAASSISCGAFALNIFFLWLIFNFLSTALINSAQRN